MGQSTDDYIDSLLSRALGEEASDDSYGVSQIPELNPLPEFTAQSVIESVPEFDSIANEEFNSLTNSVEPEDKAEDIFVSEPVANTDDEVEMQPATETAPNSLLESVAEAETDAVAEVETDVVAEAEPEAETDAVAETESEEVVEAEVEAEPESSIEENSEVAEDAEIAADIEPEEDELPDMDSLDEISALSDDEQITDILKDIDEIKGVETETEPDEEVRSDANPDLEVGGFNLAEQDLGSLLESIENMSEESANSSDENSLEDILASSGEDDELSEISDILNMDENQEIVDPNTATAEAMFGADSEDLFDIDSVLAENEDEMDPKEKKRLEKERKKKEKEERRKNKKKKKGKGEETDTPSEESGSGLEGMVFVSEDGESVSINDFEDRSEEKKKGFFARLFAKLFESLDDEEEEGTAETVAIEPTAIDLANEGAAENADILAELSELGEEEPKGKKKKEKKKKEKKGKKGKNGAAEDGDEEGGEGEENEGKKKKKVKEKKPKVPEPPLKKLPQKKVIATFLLCISIGAIIAAVSYLYPHSVDIHKARKHYATGNYETAFRLLNGHKLSEEDQIIYDKAVLMLKIEKRYSSYTNYLKMDKKIEALNALIQGVKAYDDNIETAATYQIEDSFNKSYEKIVNAMSSTFGLDEAGAREILLLSGTKEYNIALYNFVNYNIMPTDASGEPQIEVVEDNASELSADAEAEVSQDITIDSGSEDNPVIQTEEINE